MVDGSSGGAIGYCLVNSNSIGNSRSLPMNEDLGWRCHSSRYSSNDGAENAGPELVNCEPPSSPMEEKKRKKLTH